MVRQRMTAVALAGALILAAPPTASAAMAVFDGTLVGKAIEQLKEAKEQLAVQLEQLSKLKEQLSFLSDMTKFINSVSDAIGEIATISLPIPNILQASSQLKSDLRCLTPDGPGWGIKFTDLNLGSICETSSKYRDALFVNQKDLEGEPFSKSEAAWAKVGQRRDALLEDTAVRGLAQGDIQIQQADKLNKAADQLQEDLAKAETLQQREHIIAQAQILQVQAMASQSQMMAQSLKLQSIAEIKKGLSPKKVKDTTGVEDEK